MIIQPRSTKDVESMRVTLRAKLDSNPALKPMLLDTRGQRIIEDVTARPNESGLFWGMRQTSEGWQGQNMLGQLWMELRDNT